MFTKLGFLKRKIRGLSFRVFNFVENNGNTNFRSNGEEEFVNNLFLSFSAKKQKRVVFDIGANIGSYSTIIEEKASEYRTDIDLHLFEPTKSCFAVIESKFDGKVVALNNFGASDSNVTTKIFYDKEQSGLASLYQRNLDCYNLKLDQSEEIILKRLDNYIEEKNIDHIDFVKIDIEGHELKAFEGFGKYMSGEFIDYIQFEYGGANLDSHSSLMDLYQFLYERGFDIAKAMPKGLEIRVYAPFSENFQYSNYVAISRKILK
ncbi:hypothetical protein LCGC14_0881050 [marine sediment metagenome]|uniref:Methyltransferase FkbM domain-containing protein n=1 Tax=marine sediment metagenome TaxID=412755 RepID=A0A0F9RLF1_9ZZZZ|nr:FkbM family methyltransferase [Methylophaga sp.]